MAETSRLVRMRLGLRASAMRQKILRMRAGARGVRAWSLLVWLWLWLWLRLWDMDAAVLFHRDLMYLYNPFVYAYHEYRVEGSYRFLCWLYCYLCYLILPFAI